MDAGELGRFWSHVVCGPEVTDCWFWVGAIADDGYGRFALRRDGRERMVRPHRVMFEHVTGAELTSSVPLMHECDIPICVHAAVDAGSHLSIGSQSLNMLDREHKGRAGRGGLGMRGLSRRVLTERSRRLRAVVLAAGWDRAAIAAVLADVPVDHPRLF
ncbi:hypothetical protein [Plantibacter sp. CFBP 8804]|uniref:hypothetical protein n=1 Tax=Plantibacter sp. CFBP 8804 TaxID=2775270 RepID=UPI001786CFC3|nr:hypothetical protein [Plantibacter sp. CFBP 8804]MBD8519173.1 hypothetical protein [Plantibacter sp. CFBP 8804]